MAKKGLVIGKVATINFPFVYLAEDYHEFDDVSSVLTTLTGKKVSFKETDEEDFLDNPEKFAGMKTVGSGYYVAVFNVRK